MQTRKPLGSLIACMLTIAVIGQDLDKEYKMAERYFTDLDLTNASVHYNVIMASDPSYEDVAYKAEICSLLTFARNKAMGDFMAMREMYGQDPLYNFWLGNIFADKYRFSEAIQALNDFLQSDAKKEKFFVEDAQSLIQEINRLKEIFNEPGEYEIHQLDASINSTGDELTPVFFEGEGELLFASSRDSDDRTDPAFYIYQSKQKSDGSWAAPEMVTVLGEFNEYTANLEFVSRDKKLFQFRDEGGGDLFYSTPDGGTGWSIPKEFDAKIPRVKIQSHFFINENETRIIYVSDENFNQTGLDLYQTYKNPETGEWSKPVAISNRINSELDEDTPYLSPDETRLYFSSNRDGTVGGFDIYMSELDPQTNLWSVPVNLGFPINSPDDDKHFKLNPDQQSGYFVSDRYSSIGEHDIFLFWKIDKVKIQGRILEANSKRLIPNAEVIFRPKQYPDEYFRAQSDAQGIYSSAIVADETFDVNIRLDGQEVYSDTYLIHPTDGLETTYFQDFMVDLGDQVEPDPPLTQQKPVTRKASFFYFEVASTQLSDAVKNELTQLAGQLKNNGETTVKIGGHADGRGPDSLNKNLSNQRAQKIARFLQTQGIEFRRMEIVGYGETQPLATNDDEMEGRELNRRVEVFIND